MTLKAVLKWENSDSTLDLNSRFGALFEKGILSGGLISPVSGSTTREIDIQAFEATSDEGLLIINDASYRIALPINVNSVITLYSKYNVGSDPTLQFEIMTLSQYQALANTKDYLIFGSIYPLANQVQASEISYALRTEQDRRSRKLLRGTLTQVSDLPTERNQLGDLWVVTEVGNPPYLYGWDGSTFINMTESLNISADLTMHRANMFPNEIHLTNNQADAIAGTFGSPSSTNRYVTSNDPRLPTQNENNALVGTFGAPSSTNRYMTEEHEFTQGVKKPFAGPPSGPLPLTAVSFVGFDNSPRRHFTLMDATLERGYLNSQNEGTSITGVYKDPLLSTVLDPTTDPSVVQGYYTGGTLYLAFDYTIDSAFRLLYIEKKIFASSDKDWNTRVSPETLSLNSATMHQINKIKGREFDTLTPDRESLYSTRKSLDQTNAYLGTGLETNLVAAKEDYDRLSKIPVIQDDFEFNVGYAPSFTFVNTDLYSYDNTTGLITYSDTVDLSSVVKGNLFIDGAGAKYLVDFVNNAADQIGIRKTLNGRIPHSVNTDPTVNSGSVIINNNPRNVLVSALKVWHGKDRVIFNSLADLKEYYSPDGYLAKGVVVKEGIIDPRIRFYGGFVNTIDDTTNETLVRNDSDYGVIEFTGYFSAFSLLIRRYDSSPSFEVSINKEPSAITIDASGSTADQRDGSFKYLPVPMVSGLNPDVLTTITITKLPSVEPLDIYGFDVVREHMSIPMMEAGRSFSDAQLVKLDNNLEILGLPFQPPRGRGARATVAVSEQQYQLSYLPLSDLDGVTGPEGIITSGTIFVPSTGVSKIVEFYNVDDFVRLEASTISVIRKIAHINKSNGYITFYDNTGLPDSTNCRVIHLFSSSDNAPLDQEDEIIRYKVEDLTNNTLSDFRNSGSIDRYVALKDGNTVISGQDIERIKDNGLSSIRIKSNNSIKMMFTGTRLDLVISDSNSSSGSTVTPAVPLSLLSSIASPFTGVVAANDNYVWANTSGNVVASYTNAAAYSLIATQTLGALSSINIMKATNSHLVVGGNILALYGDNGLGALTFLDSKANACAAMDLFGSTLITVENDATVTYLKLYDVSANVLNQTASLTFNLGTISSVKFIGSQLFFVSSGGPIPDGIYEVDVSHTAGSQAFGSPSLAYSSSVVSNLDTDGLYLFVKESDNLSVMLYNAPSSLLLQVDSKNVGAAFIYSVGPLITTATSTSVEQHQIVNGSLNSFGSLSSPAAPLGIASDGVVVHIINASTLIGYSYGTPATANEYGIFASVDGSPRFLTSINKGVRKYTIFSNSRYQSHEVSLEMGDVNYLDITELVIYGPQKPSGFVENYTNLSEFSYISRYLPSDANYLRSPLTYPIGCYWLSVRENFEYHQGTGSNADWFTALDFLKSPFGCYDTTENDGAYLETWFLGDGFELQYLVGPDHGMFEVLVDGVTLDLAGGTRHPSGFGVIDAYSDVYGRKNVGSHGFAYGYHRLTIRQLPARQKNAASSGFKLGALGLYVANFGGYLTYTLDNGVWSSTNDIRRFRPLGTEPTKPFSLEMINGEVSLSSGTIQQNVVFAASLPNSSYSVSLTVLTDDINPYYQPLVVSNKTQSGFTIKWNSPIPSAGYRVSYLITYRT